MKSIPSGASLQSGARRRPATPPGPDEGRGQEDRVGGAQVARQALLERVEGQLVLAGQTGREDLRRQRADHAAEQEETLRVVWAR